MRFNFRFVAMVATFSVALPLHAGVARFLSHPDLSPDGREVVFAWAGDLWRVPAAGGTAQPLTVHPALEQFPLFSPDGRSIVFASNREGGFSLYVMDRDGGNVRRLTWANGATDTPSAFSGDGARVYYHSTLLSGERAVLRVPLAGGTPAEVSVESGENHFFPSVDAAERRLVFMRRSHTMAATRIHYVGSSNADLWLAELAPGMANYRQLTRQPGQDLFPQLAPDGETLYWISARPDQAPNIFRMNLAEDGEGEAITDFTDDALRWLRLSRDGRWLLFVRDFEIYRLSTRPGARPEKIRVDLPGVPVQERSEARSFSNTGVEEFAVSPDGSKLALVVDHDIYLAGADENPSTLPATETPFRETQVSWHPDNRTLVYTTMRHGNRDLASYDTQLRREEVITRTEGDESWPLFSPDGAYLAYFDANAAITVVSWPTREARLRIPLPLPDASMYHGRIFSWSPDSRYLLYRDQEPLASRSAQLWALDATAPRRLSPIVREMGCPLFSGKADRVVYGALEGQSGELFLIDLVEQAEEFDEDALDELFKVVEKTDEKPRAATPETADATPPRVPEIDWEGLEERTHVLGRGSSRDTWLCTVPGADEILVSQEDGIHRISLAPKERGKRTRITTERGRGLQVTADGKTAFFLSGGQVRKLDLKSGKVTALPHRVERLVETVAERDAAFTEAWWALDRHFYDDQLHGVNWPAIKRKYQALLPHVADHHDFNLMLEYMLGELSASHMNAYPDQSDYRSPGPAAAWLGLRFDARELEERGRLVVAEVEPRSPAARAGLGLSPGLEMLAVNGEPVEPGRDVHALFNGTAGKRLTLTVRSATTDDPATRQATLRPAGRGDIRNVRYENWVRDCRRKVEEWSGGRIGYLHIRQMDETAMETFTRDLRRRLAGKEGAVIDVRGNGGGHIAHRLLMVLAQKPWSMTQIRGNPPVSENWLRGTSLEMPAACLINHNSFSNAEMFAEGFRYLGLGPVVGVPTAGGVIGTGSFTLVNGYRIRMPRVGIYTAAGENLENAGRRPDIEVEITPQDRLRGDDPQLRRAVEEVLARIAQP